MYERARVAPEVLRSLVAYAHTVAPNETGGVLLGHVDRASSDTLVIDEAVGPGQSADHQASTFDPDQTYHEEIISQRYVESDGKTMYLGDWHTHPGGTSLLSFRDRRVLHLIANYKQARCPAPVMAIVAGTPKEGWRIGLWAYEPWAMGPLKLPVGRTRPIKIARAR